MTGQTDRAQLERQLGQYEAQILSTSEQYRDAVAAAEEVQRRRIECASVEPALSSRANLVKELSERHSTLSREIQRIRDQLAATGQQPTAKNPPPVPGLHVGITSGRDA
jgi:hypothetical protein